MPKGPKGEKRPADVVSNAVRVMRIPTGEAKEDFGPDDGKDPNAKAPGKKGGAARAKSLTPERKAEIAKKAAAKRWKKILNHGSQISELLLLPGSRRINLKASVFDGVKASNL